MIEFFVFTYIIIGFLYGLITSIIYMYNDSDYYDCGFMIFYTAGSIIGWPVIMIIDIINYFKD